MYHLSAKREETFSDSVASVLRAWVFKAVRSIDPMRVARAQEGYSRKCRIVSMSTQLFLGMVVSLPATVSLVKSLYLAS